MLTKDRALSLLSVRVPRQVTETKAAQHSVGAEPVTVAYESGTRARPAGYETEKYSEEARLRNIAATLARLEMLVPGTKEATDAAHIRMEWGSRLDKIRSPSAPTFGQRANLREEPPLFTGVFVSPDVGIEALNAALAEADMAIAAAGLEEDALREAERWKTQGNAHFGRGESREAEAAYVESQRWLARMGHLDPDVDPETTGALRLESRLGPLAATIHANLAAVKLKTGEFQAALEASQAAQRTEPKMTKACFREAKAWIALGQLEDAERSLQRGLSWVEEASAEEKNFKLELKKVKALQKAKKDRHREAFSEAYSKTIKREAEEEAQEVSAKVEQQRKQKKQIWPELEQQVVATANESSETSTGPGKTKRFNASNIKTV